MPEITDQELDTAKRAMELIRQLQANPKAREHFEAAAKVLDPTLRTTADEREELTKPYAERLAALEATMAADKQAIADAKAAQVDADAMAKLTDSFNRLKKIGVTDEGMEKVKALMQERTIPDPEAAFALWQRNNPTPPPEQSSYAPASWNLETDAVVNTEQLFKDPDRWEDGMITQVLGEERRRGDD